MPIVQLHDELSTHRQLPELDCSSEPHREQDQPIALRWRRRLLFVLAGWLLFRRRAAEENKKKKMDELAASQAAASGGDGGVPELGGKEHIAPRQELDIVRGPAEPRELADTARPPEMEAKPSSRIAEVGSLWIMADTCSVPWFVPELVGNPRAELEAARACERAELEAASLPGRASQ